MAYYYSGDEKCGDVDGGDYRAYLISRNQAPIVHQGADLRFKRLRAHARTVVNRVDGFLHRMIEALAAAKMHRLQRELALRGVTYRRLPQDEVRMPHDLDGKWDF
jgi:hypothetical protein